MIDLHTHTFFSDGVLVPSELVYRAKVKGYRAIAITDHGDFSNIDFIIPRIKAATKNLSKMYGITVLAGIEITYVPPALISKAIILSRKLGADIVLVHGETPAETVPEGTNLAAIQARVDILAHPGYITETEAKLAKRNRVCLEITTRRGHNITNPHVASLAKQFGANMVLNTDTHCPDDMMTKMLIKKTLKSSSLSNIDYKGMLLNSATIIKRS